MDRIRVSEVKKQAAAILRERKPDYRTLVLMHSAVSVAFLLLTAIISFFLNRAMEGNQGLAGLGTTAILQTAQTILNLTGNVLLPFWQLGILYTSIRTARREYTDFSMLTQGFRHAGSLLRYFLLMFLILMGLAIACSNVIVTLSMFLPTPPALMEALESVEPGDMEGMMQALEQMPRNLLLAYTIPLAVIYIAGYGTLAILLSYRFRMSRYLLLDESGMRVRQSLKVSNRMTKGEKVNLFKLDLSFWWYYLLQIGISGIVYIPDILSVFGVQLPVSANVANLLAYVLYCVVNLVLVWFVEAYYQTTMACAYEVLKYQEE